MLDAIRDFLGPHYLIVKWIHVLSVGMWAFSTAVGYSYMVKPAYLSWKKDPTDAQKKWLRDWTLNKFDHGVVLEHVAFPLLILTGLLMVWIQGWPLDEVYWLTVKIGVVILIFGPIEVLDYHLSHYAGRKSLARDAGDEEEYEKRVLFHWRFLNITTVFVVVFIPLNFFLAIVKPF